MKTLKFYLTPLFVLSLMLSSCSESDNKKGESEEKTVECNATNAIEYVKVDGEKIDFEPKHVFASKAGAMSYRIIYINYDMEEYSDYGKLKEGQKKLVIMLNSPENDKFTTGEYLYEGNKNGKNKSFFQLTIGEKNYYHSASEGADIDYGGTTINQVDDSSICGTATMNSFSGHEIKVSFNTETKKI